MVLFRAVHLPGPVSLLFIFPCPLVNIQNTLENGHRNSWSSYKNVLLFHTFVSLSEGNLFILLGRSQFLLGNPSIFSWVNPHFSVVTQRCQLAPLWKHIQITFALNEAGTTYCRTTLSKSGRAGFRSCFFLGKLGKRNNTISGQIWSHLNQRPHHRWWLVKGIIPKWSCFRLLNSSNLPEYPRIIHIGVFIVMCYGDLQ